MKIPVFEMLFALLVSANMQRKTQDLYMNPRLDASVLKYAKLDLAPPNPQKLAAAVSTLQAGSHCIGLSEFNGFFERFLRSLLKQLEQERVCIFLDVDGVLLPFGASDTEDLNTVSCQNAAWMHWHICSNKLRHKRKHQPGLLFHRLGGVFPSKWNS